MCISILPENKKADISRRQNLIPPKKTSGSHCVRAKKKPPRQATNSKKVCYWRNSTPALDPILAQKSDPCTRACPKTLTPFHFLRFPPRDFPKKLQRVLGFSGRNFVVCFRILSKQTSNLYSHRALRSNTIAQCLS